MFQGQGYVCRSNLLQSHECLQGLRRVLHAHAELGKGRKGQRAAICSSSSTLGFVISILKIRFWQVVFIGTCWETAKEALWFSCADAEWVVALFQNPLSRLPMLWLPFVPPAVTVLGLLGLEVFLGSNVCLYIPPVPLCSNTDLFVKLYAYCSWIHLISNPNCR